MNYLQFSVLELMLKHCEEYTCLWPCLVLDVFDQDVFDMAALRFGEFLESDGRGLYELLSVRINYTDTGN
jgi:hypothetical protein